MSHIEDQVHKKFKVFVGELDADNTIGALAEEITKFASASKIAPKSIGIEYLESVGRIIVTLGYREDEEPYPISLVTSPLGKIDSFADDFTALERAMTEASSKQSNIICHELYATAGYDLLMIFMTHQA